MKKSVDTRSKVYSVIGETFFWLMCVALVTYVFGHNDIYIEVALLSTAVLYITFRILNCIRKKKVAKRSKKDLEFKTSRLSNEVCEIATLEDIYKNSLKAQKAIDECRESLIRCCGIQEILNDEEKASFLDIDEKSFKKALADFEYKRQILEDIVSKNKELQQPSDEAKMAYDIVRKFYD